MIADAVRFIAQDNVEVVQLMGPGVDPHLYKVTPGDISNLARANLVFVNGLHLEGRIGESLHTIKSARIVEIGESLPADSLRHPPDAGGQPDPHIWFDVALWSRAMPAIGDAVAELVPEKADFIRARTTQYQQALAALDGEVRSAIESVPAPLRVLVTAHDAFGYFGQAYGLEVHSIQGISTESEAGLESINRLVNLLVDRRIPAVFVESSVPHKTIESLMQSASAKSHKVNLGGELFSDALGQADSPAGTYIGMVRHNVGVIVQALGGQVPPTWNPPSQHPPP
jgi:manganese/zinc/iron transport system substrate-binding protein